MEKTVGCIAHRWIPNAYIFAFVEDGGQQEQSKGQQQSKKKQRLEFTYTYIRKKNELQGPSSFMHNQVYYRCDCDDFKHDWECRHIQIALDKLFEMNILDSNHRAFGDRETPSYILQDIPHFAKNKDKPVSMTWIKPTKEEIFEFERMHADPEYLRQQEENFNVEANLTGWRKVVKNLSAVRDFMTTQKSKLATNANDLTGKLDLCFACWVDSMEVDHSNGDHKISVILLGRKHLADGGLSDLVPLYGNTRLTYDKLIQQIATAEDRRILSAGFRSAISEVRQDYFSSFSFYEESFDQNSFIEIFGSLFSAEETSVSSDGNSDRPLQKTSDKSSGKIYFASKSMIIKKQFGEPGKICLDKRLQLHLVVREEAKDSDVFHIEPALKYEKNILFGMTGGKLLLPFYFVNNQLYNVETQGREELFDYFKKEKRLQINRSEFDDFYAYYLNNLDWPDLELPEGLHPEEVSFYPTAQVEMAPESAALPIKNYLAKVHLCYRETKIKASHQKSRIFDTQSGKVVRRNLEAEGELLNEITKTFSEYLPDQRFQKRRGENRADKRTDNSADNTREHYSIALADLPQVVSQLLEKKVEVVLEKSKIRQSENKMTFTSSGEDWLDLRLEMNVGEMGAIPPKLILDCLRKRQSFVRLENGDQALLPEEWLRKYAGFASDTNAKAESIGLSKIQSLLLFSDLEENAHLDDDKKIETLTELLHQLKTIKKAQASPRFLGKLRDYQRQGLGWLQKILEQELGGILADDMGLGKTVQVLAAIDSFLLSQGPILIVAPKSLIFNWENEIEKFTPHIKVLNLTGANRHSKRTQIEGHNISLITYATLRADIEELKEIPFAAFILDEAQAIKNRESQAYGACRLIKASKKLALTGTPIENSVADLFSILDIVIPGLVTNSMRNSFLQQGSPDELKELGKALKPFILRRTKEAVLKDLPEKVEEVLYCDLSPKAMADYNKLKDYYWLKLNEKISKEGIHNSRMDILEAMLRLRQLACHPGLIDPTQKNSVSDKFELLLEEIESVAKAGHKMLIFSQFTSLLALLLPHLDRLKLKYEYLDGSTQNRQERVERFQNDPHVQIFVLSLKAGGVGLNLTAADYVFLLDPWWNPAVESQAIDRTHRIGQTKKVMAYKLVAKGTIEDKIIKLQKKKKDLADAIMSAEGNLKSLNLDDLKALLS